MDFRIIQSPSSGALEIISRRMGMSSAAGKDILAGCDAIGLIQGKLIDMVYVADLAEKAAGITAVDIRGSCPQNMVLLALIGDTASVETAVNDIKLKMKKSRGSD
ncbi:BMC domain-containing protein [Enterococcus sp. BWR-S5]|uniref:BMC domain-containing protein n=1 Tax=Enterococcus sp. BWR-S5 TaxID=2787714 RepID=UPI001922CEF5|nr:BMC domain-containing protein [Enterococcus sp. BWR-S5]MBL1224675.1 BMC domain-containing protein [Enterococcus sp. BWR-S5]